MTYRAQSAKSVTGGDTNLSKPKITVGEYFIIGVWSSNVRKVTPTTKVS